jgi:hypothetical protein
MTKRRKQQRKRRDSRAKQAETHDRERWTKALAQYQGSVQELVDNVNDRIRAVDGEDAAPAPVGPESRMKKRQKTRDKVR